MREETTEIAHRLDGTVGQLEAAAVEALGAVEDVQTPEDAEALLRKITAYQQAVRLSRIGQEQERRWAGIRLRAERKMGELLGPAEPKPGPGRGKTVDDDNRFTQDEKDARVKARKVAAIPDDTFTAYVDTADEPTRAGLLRAARPAPDSEPPPYTSCPTCGHRVRADRPLNPRCPA